MLLIHIYSLFLFLIHCNSRLFLIKYNDGIGSPKLIRGECMNEKWASLEEVAEYLGVTKDTIRNWIKKSDIPANKVGRQWKFKLSEIDDWVKSGKSASI